MNKAVLNSKVIAIKAGDIIIYNYDGETREYISTSTEYLAVGVGIPACSCLDAPGSNKAGYAICRSVDLNLWEYVPDHRGETVYSTETGQKVTISDIGDYPENTTTKAPSTQFDKWNGTKWVTDEEAQHESAIMQAENERQRLIKHADAVMLDWRTELMLGEISDASRAKLSAWLAYKNEVKAVDVTSDPEHVNWPVPPEA
ncbi:tail fiber assembly protein [Escherichia coli]|nr:tail fiber assembly protein [Escherichia coli]